MKLVLKLCIGILTLTFFLGCSSDQLPDVTSNNKLERPTEFKALVVSPTSIKLSWENPENSFKEIKIFRSLNDHPINPSQGELVYIGKKTNYIDFNLNTGVRYYYSIFTFYKDGKVSAKVSANAMTYNGETVKNLQKQQFINKIILNWENPENYKYSGVAIFRNEGEGNFLTSTHNETSIHEQLASENAYFEEDIINLGFECGKIYSYSIFSFSLVNNIKTYAKNPAVIQGIAYCVNGWGGTKQMGSLGLDNGRAITTDKNGNVYFTGHVRGNFDGYNSAGGDDLFVIKYNPQGVKLWSFQLGSSSNESGRGVVVDDSENVYVSGYTRGNLDGNTNLGGADIIIVKLNSMGEKLWTKQLGTSLNDFSKAIAIDSKGDIYITGSTMGNIYENPNAGDYDTLVIKFNSNGEKQWASLIGSSVNDSGSGIISDMNGNIFVTGYTGGSLDGNSNFGENDLFILKYTSSGEQLWIRQLGTIYSEWGSSITADNEGNVYVGGSTWGKLGDNIVGNSDLFIVKFTSEGIYEWVRQSGTSQVDDCFGITSDFDGNIYITGYTNGGLDGNVNSGNSDIFVVKYSTKGQKFWTKQIGTNAVDVGNAITADNQGNIYITGYTEGVLDGNISLGGMDFFVMSYNFSGEKQ